MNRNELIFKINIEKQKIIERKLQDGTFDNPYAEELYKKLHEKQIIPLIDRGLSVTIYTQVSDVENEVNGILTYDREHIKMDEDVIIEINKKLDFVKWIWKVHQNKNYVYCIL